MSSKFQPFNKTDLVYKTIGGTPFIASVLVPKAVQSGKCPLLAHFHGGGLIVGDRLYSQWFPLWLLQFAESEGAIVVTPDYRLIPEANGSDILADIKDFWEWVKTSLPTKISGISTSISLDLSRVAVAGESAGGYLSLQSAFLFPEAAIKLVMAQYGTLDLAHPAYNPLPAQRPSADASFVEKYLKSIKPGDIRLSSIPPDHWDLCVAILGEGRHRELLGSDERLYLLKNLKAAEKVPAIWFAQGDNDPIMPREVAENFVEQVRISHPATPVHFTLQPGSHGFDVVSTMDDAWVKQGVSFAKKYW